MTPKLEGVPELRILVYEDIFVLPLLKDGERDAVPVALQLPVYEGKWRGTEQVDAVDLVIIAPVLPCLKGDALFGQQPHHLVIWKGPGEVISLHPVAADRLQEFHLFPGLHSLHKRNHVNVFGHGDHGADDALRALIHVGEKAHVDLELVKCVFLEGIEGGVAAPEVVHPHLETGLAKAVYGGRHQPAVSTDCTFSDLNAEHVMRDAVEACIGLNHPEHIRTFKVAAREVYGDRDNGLFGFDLLLIPFAHLFHDVDIEVIDLARFLKRRKELSRQQKPEGGMMPAHQGLKPA